MGTAEKVKVEIFGHSYVINGDVSPEYIRELAEYVDNKMDEIRGANPQYNPLQTAILAAMNIADEYYQMKLSKSGLDGAIEEKAKNLISLLDEGIIGELMTAAGSMRR